MDDLEMMRSRLADLENQVVVLTTLLEKERAAHREMEIYRDKRNSFQRRDEDILNGYKWPF